ncbi:trypsin-1-like [Procambarus clarkii]|uniref:trypsin-1-like n=1 Tax=Procambarus clarkii TaxID=6728 RepID=UPI0037433293
MAASSTTSLMAVFIWACVVGQAASFLDVSGVACGRAQLRAGRVKGGQDASPGEFPWLVSIRVAGAMSAHYCGGALIHKRFVLTAAHCVHRNSPKYVVAVAGEHDFNAPNNGFRQVLPVKDIISHADFSKRYIHDIALLELGQDVVWSKYVQPLCLPDLNTDGVTDALNVTVAGWGMTDEASNGGHHVNVLQKVVVQVVSRTDCQSWYSSHAGKAVVLYDTHLCAGFENGEKDACQGDSGGPLLTAPDRDGRMVTVGVVSAGIGCGRPRLPGLYTRVSRYIDWIATNLRSRGVTVTL